MLKPAEIWVTDPYAQALAEEVMPEIKVVQQENRYLSTLLKDIDPQQKTDQGLRILFVMEPVRVAYEGNSEEPGEFQAFRYFISQVASLTEEKIRLVIRPHPSDPIDKYQKLVFERQNIAVMVDDSQSLAEQISVADWVVGLQSYAMIIALAAGKRVISCIPPEAPACILPHSEIEHLGTIISDTYF